MTHKHAKLMMEYAKDAAEHDKPWELWEMQNCMGEWVVLSNNPGWCHHIDYRRKPRTININGFEIPEPVRWRLCDGDQYFIPDPTCRNLFHYIFWDGCMTDIHRLKCGLIHLTRDAATKHAKALLSFTQVEGE